MTVLYCNGRRIGMSALGQKQTFAMQYVMSALPPKADMCGATRDIRLVPIADIGTLINVAANVPLRTRRQALLNPLVEVLTRLLRMIFITTL